MSNVQKFEELLHSDENLQAELRAAVDAYEGARDDAQAFFDATIGKLAADAGLPFSYEEARDHAASSAELSDDELNAVAGGGWCYVVGGNTSPDAGTCWDLVGSGGGACAYIGIGIQDW